MRIAKCKAALRKVIKKADENHTDIEPWNALVHMAADYARLGNPKYLNDLSPTECTEFLLKCLYTNKHAQTSRDWASIRRLVEDWRQSRT